MDIKWDFRVPIILYLLQETSPNRVQKDLVPYSHADPRYSSDNLSQALNFNGSTTLQQRPQIFLTVAIAALVTAKIVMTTLDKDGRNWKSHPAGCPPSHIEQDQKHLGVFLRSQNKSREVGKTGEWANCCDFHEKLSLPWFYLTLASLALLFVGWKQTPAFLEFSCSFCGKNCSEFWN